MGLFHNWKKLENSKFSLLVCMTYDLFSFASFVCLTGNSMLVHVMTFDIPVIDREVKNDSTIRYFLALTRK